MKPHTLINVYQDPITKLHLEGAADLRQFEDPATNGLERWRVHFVTDHPSETHSRLVDPADVIEYDRTTKAGLIRIWDDSGSVEAHAAIAAAEPKQ